MASKYWLKMYHESLHDPKLASLPDNIWRRFWECCLMAGELDEGGFLPQLFEMSYTCRVSEDTLRAEFGQMAQRGFVELKLDKSGGERWYVSNFEKRQAASLTAERMKEYRKRKRKEPKEKEINTEEDTDTDIDIYRTVTRVTKGNATCTHTPEYLPPAVLEFITDLSKTTKTPYDEAHEKEYSDAAYYLHGLDATRQDIATFGEWWKTNGFYQGKPAIKSLLAEWANFKDGVTVSANGNGKQNGANGHRVDVAAIARELGFND